MTLSERQNLIGMTRIEMQSFFASLGVRAVSYTHLTLPTILLV